jgi:hypothetical protein
MKKLIPFLLVYLLLNSCEKEYCWHCEVYSKISKTVISTSEYCDMTEKEIAEIENRITYGIYTQKCARYLK